MIWVTAQIKSLWFLMNSFILLVYLFKECNYVLHQVSEINRNMLVFLFLCTFPVRPYTFSIGIRQIVGSNESKTQQKASVKLWIYPVQIYNFPCRWVNCTMRSKIWNSARRLGLFDLLAVFIKYWWFSVLPRIKLPLPCRK